MTKKILKSFLILITITNYCFADVVKYVKKDDPAPFDGYLFTPAKTLELKNTVIENKKYKLLNDSLQNSVKLQQDIINKDNDKINLLNDQNNKLSEGLQSKSTSNDLTKILWFSLGVFATGLAIYGAKQLQK